jgi:hypothetical protein
LDDNISHRSRIISELRQIASNDDIRPEVLKEATKLAHGGTGDVKTEWFEEIFGRGMEKYERLRGEMEEEGRKQDELLEKIRVSPSLERRATSEASCEELARTFILYRLRCPAEMPYGTGTRPWNENQPSLIDTIPTNGH